MKNTIARDIRLLKIYAICSTIALVVLLLYSPSSAFTAFLCFTIAFVLLFIAFQPSEKRRNFEEINVQRINVVDDQGNKSLVISNKEKFPLPIVNGKEFPRSVNPSGIVFYDEKGNECGGIAVVTLPTARRTAIIFDYSNTEAIGFSAYETKTGKYGAGFSIQDRNPLESDIMKVGTEGTNRISLENDNKNAEISLSDVKGNKRIRLRVDSLGTATIQFLNEKGEVTFSLPHH